MAQELATPILYYGNEYTQKTIVEVTKSRRINNGHTFHDLPLGNALLTILLKSADKIFVCSWRQWKDPYPILEQWRVFLSRPKTRSKGRARLSFIPNKG